MLAFFPASTGTSILTPCSYSKVSMVLVVQSYPVYEEICKSTEYRSRSPACTSYSTSVDTFRDSWAEVPYLVPTVME